MWTMTNFLYGWHANKTEYSFIHWIFSIYNVTGVKEHIIQQNMPYYMDNLLWYLGESKIPNLHIKITRIHSSLNHYEFSQNKEISRLVHTTSFCGNNQVRSFTKDWKAKKFKSLSYKFIIHKFKIIANYSTWWLLSLFFVDSCRPGSYSSTGVEPCSPCAIGEYQSSVGTSSCLKCDKGKFTQTIGSSSKVNCTGNNDCSMLKVQKSVHNKQYNKLSWAFQTDISMWCFSWLWPWTCRVVSDFANGVESKQIF